MAPFLSGLLSGLLKEMDTKIYLINSLKLGTFIYNQFRIIHNNKLLENLETEALQLPIFASILQSLGIDSRS